MQTFQTGLQRRPRAVGLKLLVLFVVILVVIGAWGGAYYWLKRSGQSGPVDRLIEKSTDVWPAWMPGGKVKKAVYTEQETMTNGIDPRDARLLQLERELAEQRRQMELLKNQKSTPAAPAKAPPPAPKAVKRAPGIFIKHDPNALGVRGGPVEYLLAAGATKIPCQIETAMNSDVGTSYFTAKVTRTVSDTKTGQHQLIGQNDTILGKDGGANLTFGSERLPTFSLKLTRADASEVELGDSPVTDQQGINGLVSGVNHHWVQKYAAALIMGVLRGGQTIVTTEVAQQAGVILTQPAQVTERLLGPAINTRSTIWVEAGDLCNVILLQPLSLTEVL